MKPSSSSGCSHTSPVLSVYGYSVRPASAEAHRQPKVLVRVRVWVRVRVRVRFWVRDWVTGQG